MAVMIARAWVGLRTSYVRSIFLCGQVLRIEHTTFLEERNPDAQDLPPENAQNRVVMESPRLVFEVERTHRFPLE